MAVWTPRWTPCKLDPRQLAYLDSRATINAVPAGRRSFKTEAAKRRLVKAAVTFCAYPDGRFFACAPTQQQAKDIFWDDLKDYTPTWALRGRDRLRDISESDLTIRLWNGAIVKVAGLDKPARIEGRNWDGGVIDEYADCKPEVLAEHILPMLVRGGWLDVIGVPGGRNHYYELVQKIEGGAIADAAHYHWKASEVLWLYLGKERASDFLSRMAQQMDPRTYDQEFNASWETTEGRVYYCFDRDSNAKDPIPYDPSLPLILCFDFNVKPGVAAILQDQEVGLRDGDLLWFTRVVDEVWIADNSNTIRVCEEIGRRWGKRHMGDVLCYGDACGGARKTSGVAGSDWDLVKAVLSPVFGDRLQMCVGSSNPPERVRVNAVNSRLKSANGSVWLTVDPRCTHVIHDFEGVVYREGTGQIDKLCSPMLSHISDAIGYFVAEVHPLAGVTTTLSQF